MNQSTESPQGQKKHAGVHRVLTPGVIATLVAGTVVFATAVLFIENRNSQRNEQKALEQIAEAYSNSILTFRDFYNQVILSKIRSSGIEITHEYHNKNNAVPIPATMSLDLIQFLNKRQVNMSMRLVSEYPFPARQKRIFTDFDRQALDYFQTTAKKSFSRTTEHDNRSLFEYAVPVRLTENCVSCHNAHPESPKRNWKIGDIRGIQVVTVIPETLDNDNINQRSPLIVAILFFFAFTMSVIFWLIQKNQDSFRQLLQDKKQLAEASAAAEAASRAKSDFLANMSHEIRTPMNGIIGMTDLAIDADNDSERKHYLNIVKNSSESLLGILNDILDFSKIEANKLEIERIPFDLHQVVTETMKTLTLRSTEKGLALICDFAANVPQHVQGDPTRLRQVLINLIGNAIKFTTSGEILVSLAVEARTQSVATVLISVRDSGIGISSDKLDTIFEAFSQADTSTTRKYGGTGLGLSISSRLVELMGGHMSVDSELGKGSTFQFTLVLGVDETRGVRQETEMLSGNHIQAMAKPPHSSDQAKPSPADQAEAEAMSGAKSALNVLLVEDNPINQQLAMRLLEKWGHHVELANDGSEALARFHNNERFDIVLMDMQMPVMGGVEATQLIRALESERGLPRVRIVAMTANAMQGDRETCLDAGMDDYLSKPINRGELAAKLDMVAQSRLSPPPCRGEYEGQ